MCLLRYQLDVVHGDHACSVATTTDQPLGIDLLLDDELIALGETQLVVVVTDVGVECFNMSATERDPVYVTWN